MHVTWVFEQVRSPPQRSHAGGFLQLRSMVRQLIQPQVGLCQAAASWRDVPAQHAKHAQRLEAWQGTLWVRQPGQTQGGMLLKLQVHGVIT